MPYYAIDGIRPVVHPSAYVHPTATLIGDVIVGAKCYVGPSAALRGDFGRLELEQGSNVQDTCVIHGYPETDTVVEEDGHIGHGAVLHGCVIRRNALVGMNAVVMDGAVIGESAIVAALAFVKAGFDAPAGHLIGGIPARVMRALSEQEMQWKQAGTADYRALAVRCLSTMVETTPLDEAEPSRRRMSAGASRPLHRHK